MSKPVLYVFAHSVWASAPQIAADELGYGDQIMKENVNLFEGAKFYPNFLKLNPSGTLPIMAASGEVCASTAAVVRYLIENGPRPGGKSSGTDLIEKLHGVALDPNFSLMASPANRRVFLHCSEAKKNSRQKGAGLVGDYVRGRQSTLERLAPDTPEHKGFYDAKLAQNGFVVSLFDGKVTPEAVQGFIAQSHSHWKAVSQFISTDLSNYLPESGFIGGDKPGEDDFHLAVWLARIVAVLEGSSDAQGVNVLEKELGGSGTVPKKVQSYWKLWSVRDSWKAQYGQTLH